MLYNEFENALSTLYSQLDDNQQEREEICRQINSLLIINNQPPRFPLVRKSLSQFVSDYLLRTNKESTAQEILAELINSQFEFPSHWDQKNLLKNLAITLSRNKCFVKNNETKTFKLLKK